MRAHTHDDAGDAHEMLTEVDNWDLSVHHRETTHVKTRRNVQVEVLWSKSRSSGIRHRNTRVAEIVVREIQKAKPGKWGYVQTREIWSPKENEQMCGMVSGLGSVSGCPRPTPW